MAEEEGPPPGAMIPGWLNLEIQTKVTYRPGDVVVSVPIKSGTTWTMNIVYQVHNKGTEEFADLYSEVPWLEARASPGMTTEQSVAAIDTMAKDKPRAFKTHSPPPLLPLHDAESGVKYVVVARHPAEVAASAHPFFKAHRKEFVESYGFPAAAFNAPFDVFYNEMFKKRFAPQLVGFLKGWWPHRHAANVLFLHFSDMKKDHAGTVKRVADFMGVELDDEETKRVLEYTSFPYMKTHASKYDAAGSFTMPPLEPGSLVRKGKTGATKEDGITDEMKAEIEQIFKEALEPAVADWFFRGGALPN
eukprot:CAMPEP_0119148226 /NCGR_PEP_ID=MMETSP1310-20130426/41517_1 /TAXON_ID=464262 /ORGANISM="Genus nov. species nov., Strain RCC2339" /LENGTH=303 /DNA_ID=CAMNT_0007140251 /DNA_START=119 /DNA_END=1030 /DNA_ORIENTATION=-